MARKQADVPHELDPLKGGLTHHPFAALRQKLEIADAPPGPTTDAERQKQVVGANSLVGDARSSSAARDKRTVARGLSAADEPVAGSKRSLAPARSSIQAPRAVSKPAAIDPRDRVTVRMERTGRGGKTVTIAEGPALTGIPIEALARDIARGMGTGARAKGSTIVVQGDQRMRLVAWLGERSFPGAVAGN